MIPEKFPSIPYHRTSPGLSPRAVLIDPAHLIGRLLVITEKIDGSNVLLHDGIAHTRSMDASRQRWLGMVRRYHAWKTRGNADSLYYGEDIYGVHAIEYDPVPMDQTFRLFAIRRADSWLSWDDVQEEAFGLCMETVPVIGSVTLQSSSGLDWLVKQMMLEQANMKPAREGLVIRTADGFDHDQFSNHICKVVRQGHVQVDEEHWSNNWTPCRTLPSTLLVGR